jgi:hypothetical protein
LKPESAKKVPKRCRVYFHLQDGEIRLCFSTETTIAPDAGRTDHQTAATCRFR